MASVYTSTNVKGIWRSVKEMTSPASQQTLLINILMTLTFWFYCQQTPPISFATSAVFNHAAKLINKCSETHKTRVPRLEYCYNRFITPDLLRLRARRSSRGAQVLENNWRPCIYGMLPVFAIFHTSAVRNARACSFLMEMSDLITVLTVSSRTRSLEEKIECLCSDSLSDAILG